MLSFMPPDSISIYPYLIGAGLLLLFVFVIVFFKFFSLWIQAYMSETPIALFQLVGMSLRKVNPALIVRCMISSTQAGLNLKTKDLEAHFLSGGNVQRVVNALIAANRAKLGLDFGQATAIDLAGRDVLDAVQTSVKPKVIDCPDEGKVAAMAKDGIQVLAKARVTVRTNIKRLVGGATEETIIARVGEGIVSTIGSAMSHKDVLENPDRISKTVLAKGLDAGTHLRSCRSTSPTWILATTLAPVCRQTRRRLTSAWRKLLPRAAAQWPLLQSRRTSLTLPRTARS